MATVASDILTMLKAALLNDPTGAVYPDAAMYPVMNLAYKQLQTKLASMNISAPKEVFPTVTVASGTIALSEGAGLPSGLLYPTELGERPAGSTSPFVDMDERDWEPEVTQGTELNYWTWREEEIKFPGATSNREVRIRGVKTLGEITAANSPILILNCQAWLAQRTAAMAALTIGSNPTRAKALQDDLQGIWDDFKQGLVKRKQAIPVRRRRTRYRRD